jgi:hypothetical protein
MATWKRLTRATETADQIDVNMDAVACMQRSADHTIISFAVLEGERLHAMSIQETPDQIHQTRPMRQAYYE